MSKLKDKQPRTAQIQVSSARVLAPGNRDTKGMILRRIKQQHEAITDIEADGIFETMLKSGCIIEAGGIGIGGAGAMSYRHADIEPEAVLLKIAL